MKFLDMGNLLLEAGIQMHKRDMSAYDGEAFKCVCGRAHAFVSHFNDYRNFGTTGANARMIVTCPDSSDKATLIQTKYKFMLMFDRFESIAGYSGD
jgi:hypothetical protein